MAQRSILQGPRSKTDIPTTRILHHIPDPRRDPPLTRGVWLGWLDTYENSECPAAETIAVYAATLVPLGWGRPVYIQLHRPVR